MANGSDFNIACIPELDGGGVLRGRSEAQGTARSWAGTAQNRSAQGGFICTPRRIGEGGIPRVASRESLLVDGVVEGKGSQLEDPQKRDVIAATKRRQIDWPERRSTRAQDIVTMGG
jgi:hypothetical protein